MLLWADGFDHYGTTPNGGRDAMLAGAWAQFEGSASTIPRISTAQSRTGGHALFFPLISNGGIETAAGRARRLLGANKVTLGFGFGLYMPSIFSVNDRGGWHLRNDANANLLTVCLQSDASIEVRKLGRNGTSLGRSGQVLTAEAWHHVECRVAFSATVGAVEIRVNGVTVLDLADLDIGAAGAASIVFGELTPNVNALNDGNAMHIDDLFVWDTAGALNNDFLGDHRVRTLYPDQDTAQADWAVTGSATGFGAIDDAVPDDDTSYVAADAADDVSEFGLQDLPAEVSTISALVAVGRLRKTDAGDCNVRMSLVSAAVGSPPVPAVAAGADRPITEIWTYWQDVFETDPATGAPWTRDGFNQALVRLERTL